MTQITVSVPDSILQQVEELAREDQVSVDQFVALALAEKVSVLLTSGYLERRAANGDLTRYRELLSKVPDVEPDPEDRRS